jgi:hypothetical protein
MHTKQPPGTSPKNCSGDHELIACRLMQILQLRHGKEVIALELKEVTQQRDALARRIPDFVKRCKWVHPLPISLRSMFLHSEAATASLAFTDS